MSILGFVPAKYAKLITAIIGSAATVAQTYYGGQHWFVMITGALTTLGVYAVPNVTPSAPANPPAPPPAA
jgi:hypothetical protein